MPTEKHNKPSDVLSLTQRDPEGQIYQDSEFEFVVMGDSHGEFSVHHNLLAADAKRALRKIRQKFMRAVAREEETVKKYFVGAVVYTRAEKNIAVYKGVLEWLDHAEDLLPTEESATEAEGTPDEANES